MKEWRSDEQAEADAIDEAGLKIELAIGLALMLVMFADLGRMLLG